MVSTIYLVRHGRPALPDREMRFLGRTDLALSDEGEGQARALNPLFKKLPLAGVFHSGLKRAAETAAIVAEGMALPLTVVPEFQEIAFGEWELMSMKEIMERDPENFEARSRDFAGFRPPGGENFRDVQNRVWPAFTTLVDQGEGDLLIAAHAGVFKTIICTVLGVPWDNMFSITQDYCGVHVLDHLHGRLTVKKLNWTPLL